MLDGMAPHVWQGPTACRDWYRDVLVAGEREGASEYFVTLGEPQHVDVTDDRGYVVVPATMAFQVHGKQLTQSGSTFTVPAQGRHPVAYNSLGVDERPLVATRERHRSRDQSVMWFPVRRKRRMPLRDRVIVRLWNA